LKKYMNIYLCGQKYFGAEVFTALRQDGHNIVGVSSPAESANGSPDRLRAQADSFGVKWMKSGALCEANMPSDVDLIVAAHSHDFITEPTRSRTKYGAIGYHPSLLPLHRGKDAIVWTIRMGDKVTGGSVYWLSETMDGGPIAAQEHVFILPGDTPEELWRRDLAPLGVKLLRKACVDIANGHLIKQAQNESIATSEPSIKRVLDSAQSQSSSRKDRTA
jgi:methionyl-tRNA formyltransferase